MMVTDPARIKKSDPGHPDVCIVHTYQNIYNTDEVEELRENCCQGKIGCVECKKRLAAILDKKLAPLREKRAYYAEKPELLQEILETSSEKARAAAGETMELVRSAMHI